LGGKDSKSLARHFWCNFKGIEDLLSPGFYVVLELIAFHFLLHDHFMVLFNEDDSLTFGQRIPVLIALMHEEDFYVVLELPQASI
jgi:hypothetical protein